MNVAKCGNRNAIVKVKALVAEFGLTQENLFGTSHGAKKVKPEGSKVAAKFRDPVSGKEWSGRGLDQSGCKAEKK